MYRITNLTLFAAAMLISLSAAAQHNVKFDSDWSFSRGGKTKNVTLPYAWNQSEAFKVHIEKLSTDTVRYTKVFKVPSAWRGKKVFIEFEGARQCAVVFLNGRQIAMHENGVMAFGVDLTQHLVFGKENRLEVLTDNDWKYKEKSTRSSFQWNDKNFNANYGGLPKHVRIHVLEKVYQTLPLYSSLGTVGT
jgi:beta-galactosidase/beta-glucuronidase